MSSDNGGIIGVVNDPTSTVASGVWQQEEQYEAKVNDTWPQRALFTTKSLRFDDGSSDSLSLSVSGTSQTTAGTISFWFKRGALSTDQRVWINYVDANNYGAIKLQSDNKMEVVVVDGVQLQEN